MMKKIAFLTMAMLLGVTSLWARPGYTKPVDVRQPDGTTITLLMHGDEYLSFMTTIDGYTVVKGDDGFYRYVQKVDGKLAPTAIIATNPSQRLAKERSFLASVKKMLQPEMTDEARQLKAMASTMVSPRYNRQTEGQHRASTIWDRVDYKNFKGLVVLVEFNDRQFTMNSPVEFYQRLTSEKNLVDKSKTYYPVAVQGSARDYFYDNSMGIFDPTFDVVGPVTIPYSCTYPAPKDNNGNMSSGFTNRIINMMKSALSQVDTSVDFNNYDLNNDGVIDIVYFIFAGYGSYVQGNDEHYIWPHASDLTSYAKYLNWNYDRKFFGRYACSVEIQDYEELAEQHVWFDGIGTICHEFSHVLGLSDHYDTDYEQNGQATTAGAYDVMDGGADHNYGLSPVGYNAFERYVLGFVEPPLIENNGQYSLKPFNSSNEAYRVLTSKTDEEFYIENRQKQGWDTYLPGHGMLIWRADCSNADVWKYNTVNISPTKMYFELLGNSPIDGYDITDENNATWQEKGAAVNLYSILENTDGSVTFEAGKNLYKSVIEDFETTPLTTADASDLQGKICNWSLTNAVVSATSGGYGSGEHVVKFTNTGMLTSSLLANAIHSVTFTPQNVGKSIRLALRTSTDGQNWTLLTALNGKTVVDIAKGQKTSLTYNNIPAGVYLQFVVSASSGVECYLDDIDFSVKDVDTSVRTIRAAAVSTAPAYNLAGQRVGADYRGLVIQNGKKMIVK